MATIEEMQRKMTLYYRKANGEIKMYATGIQDMNIFGVEKEDYELIWDFIVSDKDEFVLNNLSYFIIKNGIITLKETLNYNIV